MFLTKKDDFGIFICIKKNQKKKPSIQVYIEQRITTPSAYQGWQRNDFFSYTVTRKSSVTRVSEQKAKIFL